MAIMNRSMGLASAARTMGTFWELRVQPTDASEHLSAGTLSGIAIGGSPTGFAAFYTKCVQSLFVTPAFVNLTALTLKIEGRNQFDEPVTELLVFAAATAQQTVLCYRRITNVTTVSYTGTAPAAGDTVSIGYSLVAPRVPMLAKVVAGAILRATDLNQTGTQPTFTVQDTVLGQGRWNIAASAVTIVTPGAALAGGIYVLVDDEAGGL